MENIATLPTTEAVLMLLRQLPPREQFRIVTQILPELEREWPISPPENNFWNSLSLETLAQEQEVHPIEDFNSLLGGWPPEESIDDFITTIHQWRQENLATRASI